MFEINWKPLSEITFAEEMDFILRKWNKLEMDKFALLVEENLIRISITPTIGNFKSEFNCYSIVISKQTTLFYKIIEEKSQIDLVLFWNNSQNPNLLSNLLK